MCERTKLRFRLRSSVFARVLAVMLGIGLTIPLLVGAFFVVVLRPAALDPAEELKREYAERFAARSPDLEQARQAAARFHVQIRYEGGTGTWSTDPSLPTIADARRRSELASGSRSPAGQEYSIVSSPSGAVYLLAWEGAHRARVLHDALLCLLLTVIGAIVFTGHLMIRRALRPVRWLHEGVAKLTEGDLSVSVQRRTDDELGSLTDAFNRMVNRVREMVRSRDQLLLDVSHELRSPLTRMKVALELSSDAETRQRLATTVGEMEAMVTELLELERLRQGRGIAITVQDLMPVVRDAVAAFQDQPPGARLEGGPEEARTAIDADKIRTVLGNLLENASKYSLADSAPISVSVHVQGGCTSVRVTDDGPGIPIKDLPALFEPFFRVDRSRSRKTGGYGLGLSLCKRIMEAHGGSIAVENRPTRGATFWLRFPPPAGSRC